MWLCKTYGEGIVEFEIQQHSTEGTIADSTEGTIAVTSCAGGVLKVADFRTKPLPEEKAMKSTKATAAVL